MRKQKFNINNNTIYEHYDLFYLRWKIDVGWWSAVVRAVNGFLAAILYGK
jgi:hypothetical protein